MVEDRTLLPGCSRGLNEKTAMITLRTSGQLKFSDAANRRILAGVQSLFPDKSLLRITNAEWPNVFFWAVLRDSWLSAPTTQVRTQSRPCCR